MDISILVCFMMKILVISKEAWRDEQNGGNVLSNLFADFDAEFAQVYCNEMPPNNNVCKLYYQITDKEMVSSLISRHKAGKQLVYDTLPKTQASGLQTYSGARRWFGSSLAIFRELVWWLGRWNKREIIDFVTEFCPDVVFAPCYGSHYMHKLTKIVQDALGVPVVSYISDDFYSNNQLRFSPLFWINHFILRKHTREVFKRYSLVYTMTDEQKTACKKDFGANMKILRKAGCFDSMYQKISVGSPIRFVYAGGLYLNRWKTLGVLANAMRCINKNGVKVVLDIYSNNALTNEMEALINDGTTAKVHPVVSMDELRKIYHASDVALHVEGFDISNRLAVRLSFSTKIVDCLDSGCAVMAICDEKQAGFAYLKRNNAALCVSDLNKLLTVLNDLIKNPQCIIDYQDRAFELGRKNHDERKTKENILNDFKDVIKKFKATRL